LLLAAQVTIIACSNSPADTGVTVRDSAGVVIVENETPAWRDGDGWSISTEPVLSIGVEDGPEEYQFFRARSALSLPDGSIAVGNVGSHEIRFYDSSGKFLKATGQEGGGPGEFSRMGRIWRFGRDSIAVYDYGQARLSVFSHAGQFGRTARLSADCGEGSTHAIGRLGDARILARSYVYGEMAGQPGAKRYDMAYCLHSLDGEVIDTVGLFPAEEFYQANGADNFRFSAPLAYGRSTQFAVAEDRWYIGSTDSYEIDVYSSSGTLDRIIRRLVANRPISAEVAERSRQRTLEMLKRMGGRIEAPAPLPETMPAYRSLLADLEGNLWVQEFRLSEEAPEWSVFDSEGRYLGLVEIPADGTVTEIGSDYVLGVWRDELDTERVMKYELRKGASRPGSLAK
jgi:hypothetical protein